MESFLRKHIADKLHMDPSSVRALPRHFSIQDLIGVGHIN